MKQDVSEMLGDAMTAQGKEAKVYRALRALMCERCGGRIAEGELFTRWPIAEQLVRIMPRCRGCVPFEFNEQGENKPHTSPLILELLSGPRQDEQDEAERPSQRDIECAIEERLGPALRWTRCSKK
jgi:hypothetical protein